MEMNYQQQFKEIFMMRNNTTPTLGIIIPCYNEEQNLRLTITKLVNILNELIANKKILPNSFIFCVDDGSQDETWSIIKDFHAKYASIKGLKLIRNYGQQHALYAGMMHAKNDVDCIITLDADLQHDENKIGEFVEAYQNGADLVCGVRKTRHASWFNKITSYLSSKILKILGVKIIPNHPDFRLLSQKALKLLSHLRSKTIYLRGMIGELGLKPQLIYYDESPRKFDKPKYSIKSRSLLMLDAITTFSIIPLRFIFILGLIIFIFSIIMSCYVLMVRLFFHSAIKGWASIELPIYFIGGIQLLCLGVVGEYLGRIWHELKNKQPYIIEDELNDTNAH